jgi:hypothetical protein
MDDRALEGVWLGNDLSTPTFLLRTIARCTRRITTRCNTCLSVRAHAFALQLRFSQSLSLLTLTHQMQIRGRIRGSGGARCVGAGKRIAICCTTQGAPRPERLQTSQTWQGRAFRCRPSISETAAASTSSRTS